MQLNARGSELHMRAFIQNHQKLRLYVKPKYPSFDTGRIATVPILDHSFATGTTTTTYNTELDGYLKKFEDLLAKDHMRYSHLGTATPSARNMGVKRAWQYEKYDIEMGGNGSANWSPSEREQIKQYGKVKRAEGHHQQNVADHPDQQYNPDNIKFYKSRKEHLQKGHGGDWKNESDQPMIDKDAMLRKTNRNRVIKNELKGLGLAVAIGAGIGFSLSMITQLAQTGISPKSLKSAAIQSTRASIESGGQAAVTYGIGRIAKLLTNMSKGMVQTTIIGSLTIVALSAYQFAKLKQSGVSTRKALSTVGKETQVSLVMLAVSVIAQGVWAPAANVIMLAIGVYMISSSVWNSIQQRELMEKIQIYTIEKHYPSFA